MARFDNVIVYKIRAKALQPLHVGSGEKGEILTDSVSRKPYIQANSIAGAFGAYFENMKGKESRESLFGNKDGNKSRIVFSDGSIEGNISGELRPRVAIDGVTGTAKDKSKFEMELLGEGLEVNFRIEVYSKNKDVRDFAAYTEEMLKAFDMGEILLGGQKTNGCGKFEIISVNKSAYNMIDKSDRNAWLEGTEKEYKDITNELKGNVDESCYKIRMSAEIENSLIIKGITSFYLRGENSFADSESVKNAEGKYIVPGTSIKGVIKERAKEIAGYLGIEDDFTDSVFGRKGNDNDPEDQGIMGRVLFEDAVIESPNPKLVHRIKIDKFTGGAMGSGTGIDADTEGTGGAKFDEVPVTGEFNICINVKKVIDDTDDGSKGRAAAGLVMLALRDLGCGVISLGGLESIGRGFIKGSKISVDGMDDEFVKKCLCELHEQGGAANG